MALFASNLAGEFSKGTIRTLLVAEPARVKIIAGKIAALVSFIALAVAATLAVTIGAGALMAPGVGVETAAWWSADGLAAIATAYVNLTSAALVPALVGATIAVLTRSAAIAISTGVAWFILGEALVSAFWANLAEWGAGGARRRLQHAQPRALRSGPGETRRDQLTTARTAIVPGSPVPHGISTHALDRRPCPRNS